MASLLLAMGVAAFQVPGGVSESSISIALLLMTARSAEPIGVLAFYVDPPHEVCVALEDIVSIVYVPLLPKVDESQTLVPADPFDLEFNHVNFTYVDNTPIVISLDQALSSRSIIVFIDPSGSGKSTLACFTARFWDVDPGVIRLSRPGVGEISNEVLMQQISTASQEVYLSNTSIEKDMRISHPTASGVELIEATERAGLDGVVEHPPEGWKAVVGEKDFALSDGERQRVVIARALLKDPPVPLPDETTSALDGVNEAPVVFVLAELSAGRSAVVIAHRLSTIRRANRILILRDGAMEAFGLYEELYEAGNTYREFWDDQPHVERWRIRGGEPRVPL